MELHYQPIPRRRVVEITALVSVQYMELPKDYVFSLENHRCWELNFVDYGSIQLFAGGKEFVLNRQDMILYPPMVEHGIVKKTEGTPNNLTIAFESDSPLLYRLSGRVIRPSAELQKLLGNILKRAYSLSPNALPINALTGELDTPNEQRDLILQLITQALEEVLIRLLCDGEQPGEGAGLQKLPAENQQANLIREVQEYIDRHLGEKLTLQTISRHFNISVGKLCRDVKAATDSSLQELIAAKRLRAAKRMIRKEEYNFTQIAEQLGFSSLHYFSQWFKTQTNMSPTEYATSVKGRSENE